METNPLGFDQILKELRNGASSLGRQLVCVGTNLWMDSQIHFPAQRHPRWFSWHEGLIYGVQCFIANFFFKIL